VPYIPLIVASIMSKKLAEGLDVLTLDVKTGSGAFIQDLKKSKELAGALCQAGRSFGVKTEALITDMSQPLGKFVGNALEVYECLKILRGEPENSMLPSRELSVELTASMLVQSGLEKTHSRARAVIDRVLNGGSALDRFRQNIELQGGDPRICDRPDRLLAKGLKEIPIIVEKTGSISKIDTFAVGRAVSDIGGGRIKAEDGIDHAVGYACIKKLGDKVRKGDELGVLYCRNRKQAELVSANLRDAYTISDEVPKQRKLIQAVI